MKNIILYISIMFVSSLPALSQVELDVETGAVFSGYNDVRIPGDTGTQFSLSEELDAETTVFYRVRVFYHINPRHHVGALYAPLSIQSAGAVDRPLRFEGAVFAAGAPLEATYQFNSYRLIYRYDFLLKEKLELGVGFTAKVRDAKVAVESATLAAEKTNVGFVPILHFRLHWQAADGLGLLIDGDALAAPQGRAADVLAALTFDASDRLRFKAGYRILEGGADNDEVYNFTLVNYASVGAIFRF